MADPTAAQRRARYKQRHGGICIDCGDRTSLNKIGDQAERCMKCRLALEPPQHGTTTRYRYGCHCEACNAAHTASHRAWRRRSAAAAVTATRPA